MVICLYFYESFGIERRVHLVAEEAYASSEEKEKAGKEVTFSICDSRLCAVVWVIRVLAASSLVHEE